MRKLWDAFEVAMNDAALAEDLLRDGRARNAFHLELERTLRMFGLLTPRRSEMVPFASLRHERHEAAAKAVLALW